MPMYDFECTKCGHTFEMVIAFSAPPPPCPECSEPTERLLSAPLVGKTTKRDGLGPKGKKYLSPEYQAKLKKKAEREGKIHGPPTSKNR
jgi:putative FmdB family regulatory protein